MPLTPTIVYRTTDAAKWGAGKGAPLLADEADNNFYELAQALASVAALEPHEITSIDVTPEGEMTINLDGGGSFGPYTLPVASLQFRDAWAPATVYTKNDYFTEADGLYLVLVSHTSEAVFSASSGGGSGLYYKLIIPFPKLYDIGFFYPGLVGNGLSPGDVMFGHVAVRDFYLPAGLTNCVGKVDTAPAADMTMGIAKNDTNIGSVTIYAGEKVANFDFAADVQFVAGDVLFVSSPFPALDTDAKSLLLTFRAVIGAIPV